MQGVSISSYMTTSYSILAILYPNDVNFGVAYYETFSGLGYTIGPVFGSLLFSYGGYDMPFMLM